LPWAGMSCPFGASDQQAPSQVAGVMIKAPLTAPTGQNQHGIRTLSQNGPFQRGLFLNSFYINLLQRMEMAGPAVPHRPAALAGPKRVARLGPQADAIIRRSPCPAGDADKAISLNKVTSLLVFSPACCVAQWVT
jgi:hypothetical protein